jgi:AcrR family transcriptional regulator/DNA-binding transcriptional ArsR family regulator
MAPAATEAERETADGPRSRRSGRAYGLPSQRDRLVTAMGELTVELGTSAVGVHHVCQRAGISRRTFYELYVDRDACFLDAIGEAQNRLVAHVAAAVAQAGPEWEDRVVAATRTLVAALCADRILGHLCVVAPLAAGPDALALRRTAMDEIGRLLGPPPQTDVPAGLVLAAALGGVWELLRHFLTDDDVAEHEVTTAAINALLAPFVGRRRAAARAQTPGDAVTFVTRWTPSTPEADGNGLLVTELTRLTLAYLGAHPGACNVDIARGVDVRHESQISRHLGRLEGAGIVARRREGRTNAWRLTARGEEAVRSLRPDPPASIGSAWSSTDRKEA